MKRTVIKGCVGGRGEGWVTHHKKCNGRMQNAQTGCSPGVSAELGHKYWGGTKETDFFISFDLMVGEGWAYFSPLFLYGHSSGDTTSLPEKEATPYFTASRAVRLLERLEVLRVCGCITLPRRASQFRSFVWITQDFADNKRTAAGEDNYVKCVLRCTNE